MTVGVVSAMEEEVSLYRDACEITGSSQKAGLTIRRARYEGHALAVVQTGVGKVNAAMATQLLIDTTDAEAIICTGSAGALHDGLAIGDILIAEDCVQHDLRVDFLDLPPGQIPFTDLRFFETAGFLLSRAAAVKLPGHSLRTGRILTGDAFVQDEETRQTLREELEGDCVEMEGAAVGQVCTLNDVPFLLVRAVSDRADGRSDVDFQSFFQEAARSSARIVLRLLAELPTSGERAA